MAGSVLSGEVYYVLRERILAGKLGAGAALGEERLAEQLGVSRTPLREALRRLVETGLIVHEPRRGARVIDLTPQLVNEVFEIREALEGMAARAAAPRIGEGELNRLRERFTALRRRVAAGDLGDVGDDLHAAVFAACGNEQLHRMARLQGDQVAWIQARRYVVGSPAPGGVGKALARAFREHDAVLLALEARDPDWAETAMRAHIRATRADLLAALER